MNKMKCKLKKTEKGYEYDCSDGDRRHQGFCAHSVTGISGGASAFGFGVQGGADKSTLSCTDEQDVKRRLEKKYKKEIVLLND